MTAQIGSPCLLSGVSNPSGERRKASIGAISKVPSATGGGRCSRCPNRPRTWLRGSNVWNTGVPQRTSIKNSFPGGASSSICIRLSRWLDQYIEIVRNLPRIIEENEVISLNDILRPSYSPAIRRLGIDAAPLARSLGIGINWIIRELLRYGFYATDDEDFVVPYCWASTGRVRELLTWIGGDVGEVADADESPHDS